MKKIKNLLMSAFFLVALFGYNPALALPDPGGSGGSTPPAATGTSDNSAKNAIQQGVNDAAGTSGSQNAAGSLNSTIANVINILATIVGIVAVIMVIISGLRYITSGGSTEKVSSAKKTFLYAIIGLVIVAISRLLVRFVLEKTTQ